jgi:hypothetical protein
MELDPIHRHVYRMNKGLVELSMNPKDKTLSIRSFDFKGTQLTSNTVSIDLDMLPDIVDILVEFQNQK